MLYQFLFRQSIAPIGVIPMFGERPHRQNSHMVVITPQ